MATGVANKRYRFWILGIVLVLGGVWLLFKPSAENTTIVLDDKVELDYGFIKNLPLADPTKDSQRLIELVGTVATKDEALDFYGNRATRFDFAGLGEPPLYVLKSKKALEIGWYFANSKDDDKSKASSQAYIKRVYRPISAYFGKDAQGLISAMVYGQTTPNLPNLAFAQCATYRCQVVIKIAS